MGLAASQPEQSGEYDTFSEVEEGDVEAFDTHRAVVPEVIPPHSQLIGVRVVAVLLLAQPVVVWLPSEDRQSIYAEVCTNTAEDRLALRVMDEKRGACVQLRWHRSRHERFVQIDSCGTGPGRTSATMPAVGGPQRRTPFERLRVPIRPLALVGSTMMQ